MSENDKLKTDFEQLAQQKPPSIVREFVQFLIHNKKWWLIPILIVFALLSLVAVTMNSPAAPFIYPFF